MEITCRFCLEKDGQVIIDGPMYELLRTIDALKSLHAASRRLNIPYRSVWGRLRVSEERLGIELVMRHGRKGMSLTPEAKNILHKYNVFKCDAGLSGTWKDLRGAIQRAIMVREKRPEKCIRLPLERDGTASSNRLFGP